MRSRGGGTFALGGRSVCCHAAPPPESVASGQESPGLTNCVALEEQVAMSTGSSVFTFFMGGWRRSGRPKLDAPTLVAPEPVTVPAVAVPTCLCQSSSPSSRWGKSGGQELDAPKTETPAHSPCIALPACEQSRNWQLANNNASNDNSSNNNGNNNNNANYKIAPSHKS